MATKKPSPAQLAARKLFAARSKAGTLRKPAAMKTRKKNPVKKKDTISRVGVSKRAYVARPSQTSRKAPTHRLVARRKQAVKKTAPVGYFPNPTSDAIFKRGKSVHIVYRMSPDGKKKLFGLGVFPELAKAKEYGNAYAKAHNCVIGIESKPLA